MAWLINPSQLDRFRKSQKSVVIFDASYHLPASNRDAKQEFAKEHIIDAYFFDLSILHDASATLPNTLITDEKLINEKLSALGLRDDYKIIFYDNSDLHSACRALWMMRIFGHNPHQLYILDGGLSAWKNEGGKTASGNSTPSPKQYRAKFQPQLLRHLTDIKQNLQTPSEQIIDVRHPVRFAGGPEPRENLRKGHIPGSFCLPYFMLFDKEGKFLPLEKIRKQLIDIGVDLNSPIITTCGSGMTAPILNFVLELMHHSAHSLYDGSWSEWGANHLYPGETTLDERPIKSCLNDI